MMAVPLEQQAALSARSGGIEAGNRLIVGAEHPVLMIDRQPALGMDEYGANRAERDKGPALEFRAVAGRRVIGVNGLHEGGCGHASLIARSSNDGALMNTSGRLRR
jgi:hypothetical protein